MFVTPPVDGWTLAVGFVLGEAADRRPPTFGALSVELANALDCEVQYFATHRVVDAHAWARATPTGLLRAYSFPGESGEKLLDEGPATTEQELGLSFFDPSSPLANEDSYWERRDLVHPREHHVMAIAARWSVDPSTLGERNLEVPDGILGEYGDAVVAIDPSPPSRPWWKFWQ